ncbi:tetratricopeptide repeat protein [Labilibaculum sp. DW002]|uniref:Tetratricopeptide repeat protein n=1 Tax=Paralabilibaculum antarcticum TaxID=2912572 RepID=A0ABT5VR44_9BACT|nr:tetratricopeptide repeat protein [Labilibaculum sp. DW002]MDE5417267.1 tetratricopeptide repeat protein [Labilibaculum sp. DW002]
MNKYIALFIGFLCLFSLDAAAQKERKFIRKGNGLFENKNFQDSENEYRKALDKDIASFEAAFNLGDALYKQKKYDEALEQFQALASKETDPQRLGILHHNIGNTLLVNKKIDESIEAYKQSLRHFPDSKETKYNLEYARKMKEKEEQKKKQNKDQQNQDNKDNKDKNKDKNKQDQKNKDQDKKDQGKKDQDKKDQDKKDQDKKKGEPEEQKNKISQQDAQRLLKALENDEKKVQQKVQKAKAKAQKKKKQKIKKDW